MPRKRKDFLVGLSLSETYEEAVEEWTDARFIAYDDKRETICALCGAHLKKVYEIIRRDSQTTISPIGGTCMDSFVNQEFKLAYEEAQKEGYIAEKEFKKEYKLREKEVILDDGLKELKTYLSKGQLEKYYEAGYFKEDEENGREPLRDYRLFELGLGKIGDRQLVWDQKERIIFVLEHYLKPELRGEFNKEAYYEHLRRLDEEQAKREAKEREEAIKAERDARRRYIEEIKERLRESIKDYIEELAELGVDMQWEYLPKESTNSIFNLKQTRCVIKKQIAEREAILEAQRDYEDSLNAVIELLKELKPYVKIKYRQLPQDELATLDGVKAIRKRLKSKLDQVKWDEQERQNQMTERKERQKNKVEEKKRLGLNEAILLTRAYLEQFEGSDIHIPLTETVGQFTQEAYEILKEVCLKIRRGELKPKIKQRQK